MIGGKEACSVAKAARARTQTPKKKRRFVQDQGVDLQFILGWLFGVNFFLFVAGLFGGGGGGSFFLGLLGFGFGGGLVVSFLLHGGFTFGEGLEGGDTGFGFGSI